jgi:hypothetical protein
MSERRARRITRLEEAATARMVRAIARRYGLTEAETTDLRRETQQARIRWRAGLPLESADGAQERSDADATL